MNKKEYNYYLDIHTHYDLLSTTYLKEIFEKNNLKALTCSVDMNSYKRLEQIRKAKIKGIYFAYGLYPDVVLNKTIKENLDDLEKIDFSNTIGIGEIGLDYKITKDKIKREEQKILFKKQLDIANKLNKPVIIHSRYSEKPVLEILENYPNLKVILHWFSGNKEQKIESLKKGYYLTQKAIKDDLKIDGYLDQIFLETDFPVFRDGIKITPLDIINVYERFCIEQNLNLELTKSRVYNNFLNLFF